MREWQGRADVQCADQSAGLMPTVACRHTFTAWLLMGSNATCSSCI